MKKLILFILLTFSIWAQQRDFEFVGKSTYQSSQLTYVRLAEKVNLNVGDTLYQKENNEIIPSLIIKYVSSISVACERIVNYKINEDVPFYGFIKAEKKENDSKLIVDADKAALTPVLGSKEILNISPEAISKSEINGRFSISSYSSTSNTSSSDIQKWRYRFSLSGENFLDSSLSFNSYITFAYRADRWKETSKELNKAIRIYDLSVNYKFNNMYSITLGRTVNRKISNLSAIDGIQFNANYSFLNLGLILGSRPNISDYGYNFKYFEYGFYLNRSDKINNSYLENTLAYIEQTNNYKTDRRFLYFQHNNNLIRNVNIFLSSEVDIYKREKGISKSDFRFTSIYASARFSPTQWINFTTSYDARKNVVYYETYQSYSDSLLEIESRQGFKFRTAIKPLRYLNLTASYGYRYRGENYKSTNNYSASVSYSQLPYINSSAYVGYNYLSTNYLLGKIVDARLSKYLFDGKLNLGLGARRIQYDFEYSTERLIQTNLLIDASFNLNRLLTASISYEGTFEKTTTYSRIYLNINSRF